MRARPLLLAPLLLFLACGGHTDAAPVDPIKCGPGTELSDHTCLPLPCGPGTHLVDMRCAPDPSDPSKACGPETHLVGDVCVPIQPDGGLTDATPWSANARVFDAATGWANEPAIAVDSKGNIYVAAMVGKSLSAGRAVAITKSTDHGKTFSELKRIGSPGGASFNGDVTLAVDAADRVFWSFIVYKQTSGGIDGKTVVSVSTDGVDFPDPVVVSADDAANGFCDRPWLALAPDGSMYLSWTNGPTLDSSTGAYSPIGARYAVSKDGGAFGPQQTIIAPNPSAYYLEESPLAFDPGGNPVATSTAYGAAPDGSYQFTVNVWRPTGGAKWSSKKVLSLVAGRHFTFETYPLITSDASGVLTLTFLNGFSRDVLPYATRSTDGGNTWGAPVKVVHGAATPAGSALPWVTTDQKGGVHMLWLDNRWGAWVPYTAYAKDGVTFGVAERIGDKAFVEDGTDALNIGDFNGIVVRDGTRYAAWTDTRDGVSEVYFASAK